MDDLGHMCGESGIYEWIKENNDELNNIQYHERGLQNNEINLGLSGWIKNHKGLIMK